MQSCVLYFLIFCKSPKTLGERVQTEVDGMWPRVSGDKRRKRDVVRLGLRVA